MLGRKSAGFVIKNKKLGRGLLRKVRKHDFGAGTSDYIPKNESESDSRKPGESVISR